jgi:hypothetical protein
MYPKKPQPAKPGQARAIAKLLRAVKGGNPAHIQRAHRNAWASETPRAYV